MDFETLRATYDLLAEVEHDLGEPHHRNGAWSFWRCPFHADDDPSFGVSNDTFYCFGCEKHGDVTDWLTGFRGLSMDQLTQRSPLDDHEARLRRLEYLQREQARQIAAQEERISALERIHACTDHLRYHREMPDAALEYWYDAGMLPSTIEKYQLGYCPRCPTDTEGRPSYTIPVISNGKLWNIRHRLTKAPNGDKYRPHMAGLHNVLFNADDLRTANTDSILIVEGEKKSIIAAQEFFPNVGVMGKSGFDREWVRKFDKFRRVNVCYDPDGLDKAAEVARLFGERGRVIALPGKLDDLIVQDGATHEDIQDFIELGKKV